MNLYRCFLVFIISIAHIGFVLADSWALPKERQFYSESGNMSLNVTPQIQGDDYKPGRCKAILLRLDVDKKATEVWSKYLINNISPVDVFVSNSGKYVVTMDEWGRVGDLPLVVYGHKGELIYVHNIESLELSKDIDKIKRTISSLWWNENSISFFDSEDEYFFIRLHWGRLIVVKLSTGALYKQILNPEIYNKDYYQAEKEKWEKLQSYANKKNAEIALTKLNSDSPEEQKTGCVVAGQIKIIKAIPRLKELLKSEFYLVVIGGDRTKGGKEFYIRKAAKEALEAMGEKAEDVTSRIPEEE